MVKTSFHRASSIITKESDKAAEDKHLRHALNQCGYNKWAIKKALKLGEKDSKSTEQNKSLSGKGVSTTITIPYHVTVIFLKNSKESIKIIASARILNQLTPSARL